MEHATIWDNDEKKQHWCRAAGRAIFLRVIHVVASST